jgi:hypothetical protein
VNYFVWYDENAQKSATEKIQEAMAAYVGKFAIAPNLVLVNSIDLAEIGGMMVRSESNIQRNNFWLARDESL